MSRLYIKVNISSFVFRGTIQAPDDMCFVIT